MQLIFENGSSQNRPITIKIETDFISFCFKNEDDREFYWIEKSDWDETYYLHMKDKNWFTESMADFINENIKIETPQSND